ncbi:MAG TPA: deoxyguanosinetriphosphate triphosphohydrolase [Actinomycetota bacterium]|nr:deoxyguanosinetriphosphate triphosphohydrolase [Actinomycetota bacterium]
MVDTQKLSCVREEIEGRERATLAPGATLAAETRGRVLPEPEHPLRTAYQRDRDRILHAKAFRRLAYKTQVFLAPEGDHVRMRLTHTLEVTQIARTIARALRFNEDLVEAICLGHDLGHTPFGHLGEDVLSDFLGHPFRHNEQSLRIVDVLETRDARRGLNLTWEVRDGIVNHTWSMPTPATPEAQIARYADRIAYVSHDIDDAVRAGILAPGDLPEVTRRVLGETPSDRIDAMVGAVVDASSGVGADNAGEDANNEDANNKGAATSEVTMRPDELAAMLETRKFLFRQVYQRPSIMAEVGEARGVLRAICDWYRAHPDALPADAPEGTPPDVRVVDHVAGMTDRYALREFDRIAGLVGD